MWTIKKTIVAFFEEIEDTRNGNAIRHKLIDILMLAVLAVLCGAEGFVEIEQFGISRIAWLKKFLELPNGIPSHDTMDRVFKKIDSAHFRQCFIEWVKSIAPVITGVVAIDGKYLRGSRDGEKKALDIVSAWSCENSLVLGQYKTSEKSNEITAIPELLDLLEITGCIVTIDAMGTQKAIAKKIVEKKADYILALKGNQSSLNDDVSLFFETELKDLESMKSLDNSHGRQETRQYYVCNEISWLQDRHEWAGLQGVGCVVSRRTVNGQTSTEKRFFIYSKSMTPQEFAERQRQHWGIENALHWVLDVGYNEDKSRIRKDNAAENMAVIRHITLNMLKQEKTLKVGINAKRMRCAWDNSYLNHVMNSL